MDRWFGGPATPSYPSGSTVLLFQLATAFSKVWQSSLSLPLVLCVPFCVVVDPTVHHNQHHLLYEPFVLLKRQVDAVKGVNVRGYFKIVLISYFVFRCVRIGIDMGICKVLFIFNSCHKNILFTFSTLFIASHTFFFVSLIFQWSANQSSVKLSCSKAINDWRNNCKFFRRFSVNILWSITYIPYRPLLPNPL